MTRAIRDSYFFRERPRLMKAFTVSFVFEDQEVPWSDSEYGCQYTNVYIEYLVTDETASKAKYQAVMDLQNDEYLNCVFGTGDMLCIGEVRRTKRKYQYKYARKKLLLYTM